MERKGERGATATEAAATAALVLSLFAVMIGLYSSAVSRAEEGVLRAQLRSLRNQERVFLVLSGRHPRDLRELVRSPLSLFPLGTADLPAAPVSQALRGEAVRPAAMDGEGFPIDPWGNRYAYESSNGRVRSATPGRERW
jgi:hypothetical protein